MFEFLSKIEWGSAEMVIGYITTTVTTLYGLLQHKQKNEALKIANRTTRIENADKINIIYNNLLEDIDNLEGYRIKYFKKCIEFCEENKEEFIRFITKDEINK